MLSLLAKITVFLSLAGCSTFISSKDSWPIPVKPSLDQIVFIPVEKALFNQGGFFVSSNDVKKIQASMEEMDLYSKRLRDIIDGMARHYNLKIEEWE
jgi:hypothetical protein